MAESKSSANGQQTDLTQAASKYLDLNNQGTKTALIIAGGISIGTLLYKAYNALPSPHSSIPTAPNMHPVLGHVPFFQQNFDTFHDSLFELIHKHEIIAVKLPGFHEVFLNSPKLTEWVFTSEFSKFFKGTSQNEKFCDLFGKYGQAIFVSDGADWRFHRKIGSRMFSLRNLRDYMYSCCVSTTSTTMRVLEKLRSQQQEIDINDILGRMTFDCFTSIAFGQSFDSMSLYPKPHPFGQSFDLLIKEMTKRFTDPFWKIKRAFNVDYEYEISENLKVIDEFCHKLITEKKQSAARNITDETGKKTYDLFSLYYEHGKELSNEQMKFLALNFIIAGRDTTRMLTSWFIYDLCQFDEVKKRVVAEIDEFNAKHKEMDYVSITRGFKYLEAALCESLRYHPVVPRSTREAKQDIVIPQHICKPPKGGNYVIKKGDRLTVHQYTVSKLESYYKEPLKYEPMRFYDKGVRTFHASRYPFFNQNPRLCLGRDFALMEAKIFLYHFLTKYSFEMVPGQNITYVPGAILNMKYGMKITLKPR